MDYLEKFKKLGVKIPNILLPKNGTDYSKYAVLACDQYAAQPEYWERVEETVGDAPSTLKLIFPEAKLGEESTEMVSKIRENMEKYLAEDVFEEYHKKFSFT